MNLNLLYARRSRPHRCRLLTRKLLASRVGNALRGVPSWRNATEGVPYRALADSGLVVALLACLILVNPVRAQTAATNSPLTPTLVTLPKQERTLEEVVARLTEQSKYPIALSNGDPKRKVTVGFENTPFWQALESVAAASGTRVVTDPKQMDAPGKRILLVPAGELPEFVAIDGPFRLSVRELRFHHDFQAGRSDYDVVLEVRWEPRYEVFFIDAQPTLTRASDDRNVALKSAGGQASSSLAGYATASTVRLKGLTRESKTIASLEGSFKVTATSAMVPFVFTDLGAGKPVTQEKEGVKVTLAAPKKDGKIWELPLTLTYPPGGPELESYQAGAWLRENTLALIGPDEKPRTVRKVNINELTNT